MALVDYPKQLPAPLRYGYGFEHTSPFVRTEMATGRARQRRAFTSVPSSVTLTWLLNDAEAQLFETWFRDKITDGSDWFNINLKTPLNNYAPYRCRFEDMYSGPTMSGSCHWQYTAPVELRERPILPRGWADFPEFIVGSSIIDKALNREWPLFVYDYATYSDALADLGSFDNGQIIYIESDENQGGMSSRYKAYQPPSGATMILDFAIQDYRLYDKDPSLTLEATWQP